MLKRSFVHYAFDIKDSHHSPFFSLDIQKLKRHMTPLQEELDFFYKRIEEKLPYEACSIIPSSKAQEWMHASKPFLVELLIHLINPKTPDDEFNLILKLLENLSEKLYKTILPYSGSFGLNDIGSTAYYRRKELLKNITRLYYWISYKTEDRYKIVNTIISIIFSACLVKILRRNESRRHEVILLEPSIDDLHMLEQLLLAAPIKERWMSGELNVTLEDNVSSLWPLTCVHCTELLLKHGYKKLLDEYVDEGYTPLMHAVTYDDINSINALLKMGVDVNAVSSGWEETALFLAAQSKEENSDEIIELLLKNKADPRIPDCNGYKPWQYIIHNEDFFQRALWLRKAEAFAESIDLMMKRASEQQTKKKHASLIKPGASLFFNLHSDLSSKESLIHLEHGIKKCTIPLPLCMMVEAFDQLPGTSPYTNALMGWEQLCKDVPRSADLNKRLLFFNGKFLSPERMAALNKDLTEIKKECSKISEAMFSDIYNHINPDERTDQEAQLNLKVEEFQEDILTLLASYFEKYIVPELHFIIHSLCPEQTKMLCWNFSQNIISNGIMLITPCLRDLVAKNNSKKSDRRKHFEFGMTAATKTMTNITFPKSGGMEATTLTQGIHVKGFNFQGNPIESDITTHRPQVLVRLKSLVINKMRSKKYTLPYKSVTTDSIALAHAFFKTFCVHQLNIYRKKVSSQNQVSPICNYVSKFFPDARSKIFDSQKTLFEVYQKLLEKPPSDQELLRILKVCSKFEARPNYVDKFFLDANHNSKTCRKQWGLKQ